MTVDSIEMDNWAGDWALRELSNAATVSALERAEQEQEAERLRLVAELAEVDNLITALDERLGRRELTLERYERIITPLETDRERLSAELDELAASVPVMMNRLMTPAHVTRGDLLARWDDGDAVERSAIVASALRGKRIVVGRGSSARFDPARCSVR